MRHLTLLQLLVLHLLLSQVTKGQTDESCVSGFLSQAEILTQGRVCNSQIDEDSSDSSDSSSPSNNCFKERTSSSNGGYSTRIIPDLRVTCNGTLTGWRAAGEITNGDTSPLLQIWSKIEGQQERYQQEGGNIPLGTCDEINELQEISANSRYYECTLETPVSVRIGDIIGLVLPRERDTSFKPYFADDNIMNYVYNFHPLTVFPDPSQRESRRQREDNGLPLITLIIDQDKPNTATSTTVESTTGEPESTTGETTSEEQTTGEATNWKTTVHPTSGEPTTEISTREPNTEEATNWEMTVEPNTGESTGAPATEQSTIMDWETTMEQTTSGEPITGQPATVESTTLEQAKTTATDEAFTGGPTTGLEERITANPTTVESIPAEITTIQPDPTTAESTISEPSAADLITGEPSAAELTTGEPTAADSTTAEFTAGEPTIAEQATTDSTTKEIITTVTPTWESTTGESIITESITIADLPTGEPTTGKSITTESATEDLTTAEKATTSESITEEPIAWETTNTNREATTMEPTTIDLQLITGEPIITAAITSTKKTTTEEQTTVKVEPTVERRTTTETIKKEYTTLEPSTGKTFIPVTTAEPMTALNYPTIPTLTTTMQSRSIKRTLVNPTTVKVQSAESNPTVKPTAITPQPTTLTIISADHTRSVPTTQVSPSVTQLRWITSTTVWLSVPDDSTFTAVEDTSATVSDNITLATISLPSNNETQDITYNIEVFFGDAGNTTAISVGGLMIIIIVILLVIFFFMLKRYRKKRAFSGNHNPGYTNPIIETINVTVNLGVENSSSTASQLEHTTPPASTTTDADVSQPPRYEWVDRTYMHLCSEASLPAEDTQYTTIINASALEDSGYHEVLVESNNSQKIN